VETARVAESPGTIGSTTPFRCLGAIAAVASTRRCRTTSSLLSVASSKAGLRVFINAGAGRHGLRVCINFMLLPFVSGLLIVGCLLRQNKFANLRERIMLHAGLLHEILNFDYTGQRMRCRTSAGLLVHVVTISPRKIRQCATRSFDLNISLVVQVNTGRSILTSVKNDSRSYRSICRFTDSPYTGRSSAPKVEGAFSARQPVDCGGP